MKVNFSELMASKTNEGLHDYIENRAKFVPEAIEAAIAELNTRGISLSDVKLDLIKQDLNAKKENEIKETEELFGSNSDWDKYIIKDNIAPKLYSKKAIWGFSIFFAAIFGAFLLASNISERKGKWIVIGFGVIYSAVIIFILNQFPYNRSFTYLFNAGGGYFLTQLLWDKYIGKETTFRAKPIWKPLIISILIIIPFMFAINYNGVE